MRCCELRLVPSAARHQVLLQDSEGRRSGLPVRPMGICVGLLPLGRLG